MRKIIILTDEKEAENGMVELLHELFPECDIIVSSRESEEFELAEKDSSDDRPKVKGKN